MSGGVDSSVCAYLLKKQGYDVIGVTMQIWQSDDSAAEREGSCCGISAVTDARRVAGELDIPYYVMNFREEFKKYVTDPFIDEYMRGRTPNPCIVCNRYLKWGELLKRSRELGADYIATGHYAQILQLDNGRYTIKKSESDTKDQTYVLYKLTQDQLAHTLMPVGGYEKSEVRRIAQEAGLSVAHKKDSQDICFVNDGNYADFIRTNTGSSGTEGNFVTADGEIIKKHEGTVNYTIGQRKGLGIALGHPVYVNDINVETGDVCVGEEDVLFKTTLTADSISCMGVERFDENERYTAKIRYSQNSVSCHVRYIDDDRIEVEFERPVRAATPGQAVVIYKDDWIAGGGTICR